MSKGTNSYNKLTLAKIKERAEYREFVINKQTKGFEQWWQRKFSEAAEKGGKEHTILMSSETGIISHKKYFLKYFKPHIKTNNSKTKVLDVGCGIGTYSKFLARKGFKVTGVDFSEQMIELAKKKSGSEEIDFKVANVYNLPFKDNSFDIVICVAVFQSILKPGMALKEMKRVLKNNGTIVIITLNGSSFEFLSKKDDPFVHKLSWFKHLMLKQGFSKIKTKGIYFFPQSLNFLVDLILKFRVSSFLNLFFPVFKFVSHSCYIEATKEDI